jgi:hypothetical protein
MTLTHKTTIPIHPRKSQRLISSTLIAQMSFTHLKTNTQTFILRTRQEIFAHLAARAAEQCYTLAFRFEP